MEYLADLLTLFHSLSDRLALNAKDTETLVIAVACILIGCLIGLNARLTSAERYGPVKRGTPNWDVNRSVRGKRNKKQAVWLTPIPEESPAELDVWQDLPISDTSDNTKTIVIKRMLSSSSLDPTIRKEASININGKTLKIDPEHLTEILSLARSGQKSEAIKILLSRTPTGEEEANQLIEMLAEMPNPFSLRGVE